MKSEGKPGVFREEADGHEDAGGKVEKLVEIAVFDFAEGKEKVGGKDADCADPANNVENNYIHEYIIIYNVILYKYE